MGFDEFSARFKRLRGQFDAGLISYDEFTTQLEGLTFEDEDGFTWKHSPDYGLLYYFDGEEWIRDEPTRPSEASRPMGRRHDPGLLDGMESSILLIIFGRVVGPFLRGPIGAIVALILRFNWLIRPAIRRMARRHRRIDHLRARTGASPSNEHTKVGDEP